LFDREVIVRLTISFVLLNLLFTLLLSIGHQSNLAAFAGLPDEPVAVTPCKLQAYIIDKDKNGLNVRSKPSSASATLATIPFDEDGVIVRIIGANNNWVLIGHAETVEGTEVFAGKGWVFAQLLGTSTRYKVKLLQEPLKKSAGTGFVPVEAEVKLMTCKGEWVRVEYKKLAGWLEPDAQCPNPVTTCP
jgi:SH3-like domain-containing protein